MTHVSATVTVVVVTFNSAHLLPAFVASLGPGLGEVPWHLVVADNASADGTVELLRELAPEAKIVEMGRNAGYAAGINAAVQAAGASGPTMVLNPDVRLDPGCVPELLRVLEEEGAGIAVPRLTDADGRLTMSMRREPTVLRAAADALIGGRRAGRIPLLGEHITDPRRYDRPTTTDWAEGSTQLISAACLAACHPWDESFFLYSEETDFHLRAGDAGFTIRFVPTAGAVHLGGESATSPALWSLLVANRVKLFAQRHGRAETTLYWAMLLLREGTRALLGKETSRRATRTLLHPRRLTGSRGPGWVA
ncbi:glycosyltransferase family 2 protein [Nocardioides sp. CER19]|uniref:glycosyltransferase family 2 protein n=1 Tax=Nocardioides sp. CER19 TaxID=3038538 RepID=UPI002449B2F7|nr:glycosyltransferase family 2 protein [Nocardioides sp. CER19]MDH2414829.1 glycosyltransferase family 2 protein [Nocardioides sp. CER19]